MKKTFAYNNKRQQCLKSSKKKMYKSSDLREKDVINISDGKKLGKVCDLEVDVKTGKIDAIVVPAPFSVGNIFSKEKDYVIPWERIKKIGEDVILVEI